jgi:uridine kinase
MILLIDGRSGSGKTTLAAKIHRVLGWPIIHLEDVYPGWGGLGTASDAVAESIINPELPADLRGYRRWDWYADSLAEWVPTPQGTSLIIEGCGALTKANLAAARGVGDGNAWGIWVELDTQTRFERAMARDMHFEGHWDMWASQEDQHIATHNPQALADWTIAAATLPYTNG